MSARTALHVWPHYTAQDLIDFVRRLWTVGAFKLDLMHEFELHRHRCDPHALRSPIYFNLRTQDNPGKSGPLTYQDIYTLAGFFRDYVDAHDIPYDGVLGVPNAGMAIAKAFAGLLEERGRVVPLLTFDKEHGVLHNPYQLAPNSRVLVLDDVISDGGSKIRPIQTVREHGFVVEHCLVCIDREQGGDETLSNMEPPVKLSRIIIAMSALLILKSGQYINAEEFEMVAVRQRAVTTYCTNNKLRV